MTPLFATLGSLACAFATCAATSTPVSAPLPASAAVFNHASTTEKVVALTFDADMTPSMRRKLDGGYVASWYNASVIDVLQREHVPATLFLTGLWADTYPTTTAMLARDPLFELGDHSYTHGGFTPHCYTLAPIPVGERVGEVTRTESRIAAITGVHTHLFRYPGLCADATTTAAIAALGFRTIGGDVPGGDGFQKDPRIVARTVLASVHPGSIVILHLNGGPNAPQTGAALPRIIAGLRERGYRFVTVSELLSLSR